MSEIPSADPLRLAELIAARICHDLSGPIGPMTGMLELAQEDPAAINEALSAASQSAASLVARLRLLRCAWSADGGPMDTDTISGLAAAGLSRKRLALDMTGLADAIFPPSTARLLLNVLLLAAEGLPGGGTITCSGQPEGDILTLIDGPRAAWPPGLAACLANPANVFQLPEDPRAIQVPFIALLASRPGPRLSLLFGGGNPAAPPPLLISHRA
jgi:histidine phosphotransferase ChpT